MSIKLSVVLIFLIVFSLILVIPYRAYAAGDMQVKPNSGSPGTTVTVSGSSGLALSTVTVYFDKNGNGKLDSGENYWKTQAGYSGDFKTTLTIPNVSPGTYTISGIITYQYNGQKLFKSWTR